jgi:Ca-activated chloride channel family protein
VGRFRIAVALTTLLSTALPGAAQEPTFKVDVKLVRLLATVKDDYGRAIGGLSKEDFHIVDTGVPQEIAVFERYTTQPLSIALLVDTSGSTAKELKYETDSVARFLRALFREGNAEDTVSLFSFNWEIRQRTGFTRRASLIESHMRKLKAEAGTSMYDAIWLAAQELRERDGRKVVVIVTDGGDTVSNRSFHDALKALHAADAVLYSILVMPITNDPGRNIGGENALETMSTGTGGRVFAPNVGASLDQAFDDILRDLRTQYLLAYYPRGVSATADSFHPVKVTLNRSGLRVVTRTGYYGDFSDYGEASSSGRRVPSVIR